MSEAQKLRAKALHVRELAMAMTDAHAIGALKAFADELERQADELDGIDPAKANALN